MATTTAKNYNDVEGMSKRERLWDSLNYSYGKKGERLAQEYDKARATADRQMQSRGMQRSSYGAQTLANMDRQKIDALDDNQSATTRPIIFAFFGFFFIYFSVSTSKSIS